MQAHQRASIGGDPSASSESPQGHAVEARKTSHARLHRPPEQVLSATRGGWLLAALVAALVALTVVVAVGWQPLGSVDDAVARWGYHVTYGHEGRSSFWNAVDFYSEPIGLRVVLVALGLFQAWRRRFALAGWLVGVAVAENFAAPYAKYLLNRPRPNWPHPLAVEHTSSYPAGHAAGVALFTTAIVLLALVTVRSTAGRWAAIGVALAIAVVVSLDRIFLGLHYVSDVVGGILLGMAVVVAGWVLMLKLRRTGDSQVVQR